ncbi:aspartate-semialdehyde dehydrogenase [Tepidimicrobium xylanilyticum]|uniref:Aspartate-semialdehyde dehydrogenase n=1 Tax=Tepidimicrobium xylanilyticum TaxID=1123352 RepID=A0A1H3AQ15_9FIRM|nr:aspartate-semialdehyde dehydrogenase [Tepidimicrobium xylanilyticum]GMG97624.1 aspartate-semialdehyde dehydrogenase [Tepidimicrobium xylanilyticum]SDX31713.1 aspartate semialdehyde dehydrogenase [Tepidimicrobium xylanilyticum]
MKTYNIAVVGPLGLVGRKVIDILVERRFPVGDIKFLGTSKNKNKKVEFNGESILTEVAKEGAFMDVDIAFFCVDSSISKYLAPIAVKEGAIVIDNSSAWRMDNNVPLIIPEVNPEDLHSHRGIISNPNCSTIQMLVPLKPLHDIYKIKRIVVSTYQSVSGTGKQGMEELNNQMIDYCFNVPMTSSVYPHQILFNVLPHIDHFLENGYTKEEMKMVNETKKILDENIKVTATTVRIPVFIGHSESVNIETEKPIKVEDVINILEKAKGVKVIDDIKSNSYPMPIHIQGKDEVFVGRIRKDFSIENGINMWIVADNLRKGAALNSVQIAETLIERNIL